MADRQVGWGIISSAKIARNALIPAIAAASNARLLVLGTHHPEKVEESASEHGYRVVPAYEAVLEDPAVEAVYIPLPNGLHAPWTLRALEAGRHVLCEKPFCLDRREAAEMMAASRSAGKVLVEAFMYRFHPQITLAKSLLDEGRIGAVRTIRACFTFTLAPDLANPRFQSDQGPGALMDVGCYCINAVRLFSGGPPDAVSAWASWDRASGGDLSCSALLEYRSHSALFDCSFEASGRSGLEIVGSSGRIEIPRPWLPGGAPGTVKLTAGGDTQELSTEGVDHYRLMVEDFSNSVLNGTPPRWGPEDAVENMRVMDAVRLSAQERRRVPLTEVEAPTL